MQDGELLDRFILASLPHSISSTYGGSSPARHLKVRTKIFCILHRTRNGLLMSSIKTYDWSLPHGIHSES